MTWHSRPPRSLDPSQMVNYHRVGLAGTLTYNTIVPSVPTSWLRAVCCPGVKVFFGGAAFGDQVPEHKKHWIHCNIRNRIAKESDWREDKVLFTSLTLPWVKFDSLNRCSKVSGFTQYPSLCHVVCNYITDEHLEITLMNFAFVHSLQQRHLAIENFPSLNLFLLFSTFLPREEDLFWTSILTSRVTRCDCQVKSQSTTIKRTNKNMKVTITDTSGIDFFDERGLKIVHDENIVDEAVSLKVGLGLRFKIYSDHEEWRLIGYTISHCKKLENITFYRVSNNKFKVLPVIFRAEGPYDFPLKKLEFVGCDLRDNMIANILPFLQSRKQLDALHVLDDHILKKVAPLIAVILDRVTVQCLNLNRAQFDGEGLTAILSSRHSKCLRKFTLALHDLRRGQMEEIGRFLSRNDIELECLEFGPPPDFDNEKMDILFQSLQNNRTVRKLTIFREERSTDITYRIRQYDVFIRTTDAIMALICNTSTFETLCRSNHVFGVFDANDERGCKIYEAPPFVKHALEINENCDASTNQKLRKKLESFYFREEYDLQPFLAMKSVCIPNLLEMIANSTINAKGEEEDNLSGLYRFIRNCNCNFIPSPEGSRKWDPNSCKNIVVGTLDSLNHDVWISHQKL